MIGPEGDTGGRRRTVMGSEGDTGGRGAEGSLEMAEGEVRAFPM